MQKFTCDSCSVVPQMYKIGTYGQVREVIESFPWEMEQWPEGHVRCKGSLKRKEDASLAQGTAWKRIPCAIWKNESVRKGKKISMVGVRSERAGKRSSLELSDCST